MTEPGVTREFPPIIARHLAEIVALAKRYGVKRLEVFGSVMTDRYDPFTSDVDFLVTYPEDCDVGRSLERHQELKFDLRFTIKSPTDLVTDSALRNGNFLEEANKTRRVIYDERSDSQISR